MNRDKQIEEMYKDVYKTIEHNAVIDITHGGYIGVNTEGLTRELYDDGYRKASEVAREILEEIEDAYYECIHINPTTNIGHLLQTKFLTKLAELKEKHIGEDTNVLTNTEGEG